MPINEFLDQTKVLLVNRVPGSVPYWKSVRDFMSMMDTDISAMTVITSGLNKVKPGAPVAASTKASVVVPGDNGSTLTISALYGGVLGNTITIEFLGGESQSLAVTRDEAAYTVQLGTDGDGLVTSTLAEIKAAIDAEADDEGGGSYAFQTVVISSGDEAERGVVTAEPLSLSGGADNGTVADENTIYCDGTKIYIAGSDQDGSQTDLSNWKIAEVADATADAPLAKLVAQVGTYDPVATGRTLADETTASYGTLTKDVVARKIESFSDMEDIAREKLSYKNLILPNINDTTIAYAELEILTANTDLGMTITSKQYGLIGNYNKLAIVAAGNNTPFSISVSVSKRISPPYGVPVAITVNLETDENGDPVTTINELYNALGNDEIFNQYLTRAKETGEDDSVIAAMAETYFSGGDDGHPLQASSAGIDTAVANSAIEGTPVTPVASTGSIEIDTGISLDFTAQEAGDLNPAITINLIDPAAENLTIDVAVNGNEIDVTLASSDVPAITSTAADVKAAIEATPAAAALVAVAITGLDSTLAIAETVDLSGGVDGVAGLAGAQMYDATGLYVSVGESTTAESNWHKISFDAE